MDEEDAEAFLRQDLNSNTNHIDQIMRINWTSRGPSHAAVHAAAAVLSRMN